MVLPHFLQLLKPSFLAVSRPPRQSMLPRGASSLSRRVPSIRVSRREQKEFWGEHCLTVDSYVVRPGLSLVGVLFASAGRQIALLTLQHPWP